MRASCQITVLVENKFYTPVFENEHFIAVDKKALVLSVPARLGEVDARPVLGRILEADLKMTLFPVHRLDYEVQGLIMFAKTTAAHRAGNAWFEKKEVFKTYRALTKALDEESNKAFVVNETYSWRGKVLRGKKRAYLSSHGKDSLTLAKIIKIEEGVFHWELNPVTGRSHQLRFDLFRHGHPIIGDELYSSNQAFGHDGIALRAFKIDFTKAANAKDFLLPDFLEIYSF